MSSKRAQRTALAFKKSWIPLQKQLTIRTSAMARTLIRRTEWLFLVGQVLGLVGQVLGLGKEMQLVRAIKKHQRVADAELTYDSEPI